MDLHPDTVKAGEAYEQATAEFTALPEIPYDQFRKAERAWNRAARDAATALLAEIARHQS